MFDRGFFFFENVKYFIDGFVRKACDRTSDILQQVTQCVMLNADISSIPLLHKPEAKPKGPNIISPDWVSIKIKINRVLGCGLDWSYLVHRPSVGLYRVSTSHCALIVQRLQQPRPHYFHNCLVPSINVNNRLSINITTTSFLVLMLTTA
jgi:hypothetical protein